MAKSRHPPIQSSAARARSRKDFFFLVLGLCTLPHLLGMMQSSSTGSFCCRNCHTSCKHAGQCYDAVVSIVPSSVRVAVTCSGSRMMLAAVSRFSCHRRCCCYSCHDCHHVSIVHAVAITVTVTILIIIAMLVRAITFRCVSYGGAGAAVASYGGDWSCFIVRVGICCLQFLDVVLTVASSSKAQLQEALVVASLRSLCLPSWSPSEP